MIDYFNSRMQKAGSNVVVIFFLHKATVYVSDPQVAKVSTK